VLWVIHRRRIFFSGTLEPPAPITVGGRPRTTSVPGVVQHDAVLDSHHSSADFAGLLARPSPLHEFV
jgi:hypothetical protein